MFVMFVLKVGILVVFHASIYKMASDVKKKYGLYSLVMWDPRFLFDQIGLLDEWNHFWIEIPGKMFRRDITPDKIRITTFIDTKKLNSRAGASSGKIGILLTTRWRYK